MRINGGIASATASRSSGATQRPYDLAGVVRDKRWSDQFMTEVRQIVGTYLLTPTPLSVDRTDAADLVILRGRAMSIAVRIRKSVPHGCEFQFTLRSGRATGAKSELDKIIDGKGDWLFYGIECKVRPGTIGIWNIVDLAAFRSHLIRNPARIRRGSRPNDDGVSEFTWFDLKSFPVEPPLLVASSHPSLQLDKSPNPKTNRSENGQNQAARTK